MSYRFWLFIAGISGAVAVLAGAYGEHALGGSKAFSIAQVYHLVHTAALFGIGVLLAATEERRGVAAGALLQLGGVAFVLGISGFVGGVYYHLLSGVPAPFPIVPAGGISFATGWVILAVAGLTLSRR
jgi:uncharacterized membrane protein YgdD (TMEM256/DUF423 family)